MDITELKKIRPDTHFNRHPWETTRLKVVQFFLKRLNLVKAQIVDIGSGDAFIINNIALLFPDCSVTAVDINYNDEIIKTISSPILPNITYTSDITSLPDSLIPDMIILMDILEHNEQPEKVFENIKKHLIISPATKFFITLPAFQFLFTEHDVKLGHYRRYSRKALKELLRSNGFRLEHSGYFFTSLFLIRTWQKLTGIKMGNNDISNWAGGNLSTFLLTVFFSIEFKISWYLSRMGVHLPGLTCYCICSPLQS